MNKLIKLPLFLGVVGGLCGAILAATNLITEPRIEAAEKERIAAAYKEHFTTCSEVKDAELSAACASAGATALVKAYDSSENYLGSIYTVTVKGYGGDYTFTVSFANDKIHKVIEVSGNESNVGKTFLDTLYAASDYTVEGVADFKSGSSVTYGAVVAGISACYTDYEGGK